MTLTRLVGAAAALSLAAGAALAEDIALSVPLISTVPDTYSAGFSLTHLMAGLFTDTITFSPTVTGTVSTGVFTFGFTPATDINFTSAMLNGQPLTLTGAGTLESGLLSPVNVSGPFVLTVSGFAGVGLADDAAISASYSGVVNVTAVPEPGTLALLLAGVAAVGFVARRRGG
ncbi:FxDxF family PEP-CTERM protein [Aquabacterium sp.]|uniref:FxDxF family PEP-CTERM protein n=1 Tax=Aquabacterium sp. TaxID=1872578 RepID=UPI002C4B4DC8|nr:FxDxF family PEP-CTERM protein [Aquabacterium sp.]HSW06495.1 FxDxF family PEP-CTERM protein [Aquabacterium sp.]